MDDRDIEIVYKLPLPPTVNHMYKRYARKTMLTPEARRYKWLVMDEVNRSKPTKFALDSTIGFGMCIYPSNGTEARRDVDNGVKIVLDAFQSAGLYPDDNQVKEMHIKMMGVQKIKPGYIIVSFYEIE